MANIKGKLKIRKAHYFIKNIFSFYCFKNYSCALHRAGNKSSIDIKRSPGWLGLLLWMNQTLSQAGDVGRVWVEQSLRWNRMIPRSNNGTMSFSLTPICGAPNSTTAITVFYSSSPNCQKNCRRSINSFTSWLKNKEK